MTALPPDPHVCREKTWIPFIIDELGGSDPESVVVGHSSGAVAALRLAEKQKLKGIIVVAGYDSDLGDANERASGYFNRPFDWAAIRANCQFVAAVGGARVRGTTFGARRGMGTLGGVDCTQDSACALTRDGFCNLRKDSSKMFFIQQPTTSQTGEHYVCCVIRCRVPSGKDDLVDIAIQRRVACECLGLKAGTPTPCIFTYKAAFSQLF